MRHHELCPNLVLQLAVIAGKMEQRAVKAKEMDIKTNSDFNEKRRESMRETEKICKDLTFSLRVFSEDVILNHADRKELEFAFKIKKPLRCHWALRTRPKRKRLKTGSFVPLEMKEDLAANLE
ncbi:UNVERIFIED_CONTAM: hypothetical protein K2H54_045550 [Gekko kuhli]